MALSDEQWQSLSNALENAVTRSESGEGGGHAALIQLLNQVGYTPLSSQEAERIAQRILDAGYDANPKDLK